ncbi:MAG: carbohydrate ABC transporter permease [Spirochaetia bacterium]
MVGVMLSRKAANAVVVHVLLVAFVVIALIPLVWVALTSIKPDPEVVAFPPRLLPLHPTVKPYIDLWQKAPFLTYTRNSTVVALGSAFLALLVSSLAAYGMARFRFKGVKVLLSVFLLSQMFPGASILIPVTQTVVRLHIYNTLQGLIFVYTAFFIPFACWMLYGYFRMIPKEIDEAAYIDGCSKMGILFRMIIPLTIPGLAATFVFAFLGGWNEFLFALVMTNSERVRTLPVGMWLLVGQYITYWNMLSSSAILFALPPLVFFFLLEKALVTGLTAGAVKG